MSQQLVETALLIQELTKREARKSFLKFKPYPSQRDALDSMSRIIGLLGGNQCLGAETTILDPTTGRERAIGHIYDDFHVWAWDGEKLVIAKAKAPVLKGPYDIYELTMEDGRSFTASGTDSFSLVEPPELTRHR